MYKSSSATETIVKRQVAPCRHTSEPLRVSPRVHELSEKKKVSMAQIALAWTVTKVTAPIIGTTKLENLKEMIGENRVLFASVER